MLPVRAARGHGVTDSALSSLVGQRRGDSSGTETGKAAAAFARREVRGGRGRFVTCDGGFLKRLGAWEHPFASWHRRTVRPGKVSLAPVRDQRG